MVYKKENARVLGGYFTFHLCRIEGKGVSECPSTETALLQWEAWADPPQSGSRALMNSTQLFHHFHSQHLFKNMF